MRYLTLVALSAALALTCPATLSARTGTWGDAAKPAARYTGFAELFWQARGGYVNCPQGVEVTWWNFLDGLAGWADGYNGIGGCHIWLNPDSWPTIAPFGRCHVLLHEWGHLIGLSHEPDPLHVMHVPTVRLHPSCLRFR